jgi:hypothetical protein
MTTYVLRVPLSLCKEKEGRIDRKVLSSRVKWPPDRAIPRQCKKVRWAGPLSSTIGPSPRIHGWITNHKIGSIPQTLMLRRYSVFAVSFHCNHLRRYIYSHGLLYCNAFCDFDRVLPIDQTVLFLSWASGGREKEKPLVFSKSFFIWPTIYK